MRWPARASVAALITGVLAAAVVGVPVGAAPRQAGGVAEAAADGPPMAVTLVTGDHVTVWPRVGAPPRVQVRPSGSSRSAYAVWTDRQRHVHVVPTAVVPQLRGGSLDERLFDVTALAESGQHGNDDAGTPLLVSYCDTAAAARAAPPAQVRLHRRLPALGMAAVRPRRAELAALWAALRHGAPASGTRLGGGVCRLWLDGVVRSSLDRTVPRVGAPAAWDAGYTGAGVLVAVLDTGYDHRHPDLRDRVSAEADFTGSGSTDDRIGHGTHVASTIVGSGAASGGRYRGVAPGARLLVGKVLDDSGTESAVLAGMEWAAAQRARIVSMSLGGGGSDGTDPVSQAVNRLSAGGGPLFVVGRQRVRGRVGRDAGGRGRGPGGGRSGSDRRGGRLL